MPDFSRLVTKSDPEGRLKAVMDMLTETKVYGEGLGIPQGPDILEQARINAAMRAAQLRAKEAQSLAGDQRRIELFQAQAALDALRSGQRIPPEETEFEIPDLVPAIEANQSLEASRRNRLLDILQGRPLSFGAAIHGILDRIGTGFPR